MCFHFVSYELPSEHWFLNTCYVCDVDANIVIVIDVCLVLGGPLKRFIITSLLSCVNFPGVLQAE